MTVETKRWPPWQTGDLDDGAVTPDKLSFGAVGTGTPQMYPLIIGVEGEDAPSESALTVSVDTVNYKIGDRAIKLTTDADGASYALYQPLGVGQTEISEHLTHEPADMVGMWVYFAAGESAKVTSIRLDLGDDPQVSSTDLWQYTWTLAGGDYADGWNLLTASAELGGLDGWGTRAYLRPVLTTTEAAVLTFQIFLSCPAKPRLLLIADGPYESFYTDGYPDCKARNIPVTFATIPTWIDTANIMTSAQLAIVAAENQNEISFHSWAATSPGSAADARKDTVDCLKWLRAQGYETLWRAAWYQQICAFHADTQPYLAAYATATQSMNNLNSFPTAEGTMYDFGRQGLNNITENDMDTMIADWLKTNSILTLYTHGIDVGGGNSTTPTEWAYFLAKLDVIDYQGVTFNMLAADHGWKVEKDALGGRWLIRRAIDGTETATLLT